MGKKVKQGKRFLGTFTLPDGQKAFGDLQFSGAETALKLRYEQRLQTHRFGTTLHGELHNLRKVSCISCVVYEEGTRFGRASRIYTRVVFPHYVFLGARHFDPAVDRITWLQFDVGDLGRIFDDYDAFGDVDGEPEEIGKLIPEKVGERPVPTGPHPRAIYFAGREVLADVKLPYGRFIVRHLGTSTSTTLKSQLVVNVDFDEPTPFEGCLERVQELRWFLSILAGREQGINGFRVRITIPAGEDDHNAYLRVRWPMRPRDQTGASGRKYRPDSLDIPIDPIRRPDEFSTVLQKWYARFPSWRQARARWDGCLRQGNEFDANRLVAAANLFDLLPPDAFPPDPPIDEVLANALKEARVLIRKAPNSNDRNSALDSLGRVGRPSLTKRVAHCVQVVRPRFGDRLARLDEVARLAVRCRNYYVHGSDDPDVASLAKHMIFLTETLEFIFSARDLIDAGWQASKWWFSPHTSHHWYTRYLSDYRNSCEELLGPITPASPIAVP